MCPLPLVPPQGTLPPRRAGGGGRPAWGDGVPTVGRTMGGAAENATVQLSELTETMVFTHLISEVNFFISEITPPPNKSKLFISHCSICVITGGLEVGPSR